MKAFAINRPLNGTIWEVDGIENIFGDLVVCEWLGQPNAIVPRRLVGRHLARGHSQSPRPPKYGNSNATPRGIQTTTNQIHAR
jgi:hypothetical protein